MSSNFDIAEDYIGCVCEHDGVCGACDELDRADCNFFQPKVDRDWLAAIAKILADRDEWETAGDANKALDFARQIIMALGMEPYQVLPEDKCIDDATETTEQRKQDGNDENH